MHLYVVSSNNVFRGNFYHYKAQTIVLATNFELHILKPDVLVAACLQLCMLCIRAENTSTSPRIQL